MLKMSVSLLLSPALVLLAAATAGAEPGWTADSEVVASADRDLWADPRGEFLAFAHASPVYALWGEPSIGPDAMPPLDTPLLVGRRGYHVRSGGHNLTPYDWHRYMDLADRVWPRD